MWVNSYVKRQLFYELPAWGQFFPSYPLLSPMKFMYNVAFAGINLQTLALSQDFSHPGLLFKLHQNVPYIDTDRSLNSGIFFSKFHKSIF